MVNTQITLWFFLVLFDCKKAYCTFMKKRESRRKDVISFFSKDSWMNLERSVPIHTNIWISLHGQFPKLERREGAGGGLVFLSGSQWKDLIICKELAFNPQRERDRPVFTKSKTIAIWTSEKTVHMGKKSPILNTQTDILVLGTDILVSFPIVYLTTINIKFIVFNTDSLILGTIDFSNIQNNKLDIVQFFHQNISCSLAGH